MATSSVGGKKRARGWAGPPKLPWLRLSPSSFSLSFVFFLLIPPPPYCFSYSHGFPPCGLISTSCLGCLFLLCLPLTVPLPFSVLTIHLVSALLLQVSLHLYPLTLELSTSLSFLPPSFPPHLLILQSGGGFVGFRHHETNVPRLVTKEVVSLATESAGWGCTALSLTLLLQ